MNAPPERASNGPTPSGGTGRLLAVVRDGAKDSANDWLHRRAGIRNTFAPDVFSPGHGESVYFSRLGVALIDAPAEQIARLHAGADSPFLSLEPEQRVRLIKAPRSPDTCAVDETDDTWGRIKTGVIGTQLTGRGTSVCVLDTGIDEGHPDFVNRIAGSRAFDSPTTHDTVGHGTHCAGTICGPAEPREPPRYGIASDAKLFVGKVFDDSRDSRDGTVIAGLEWALSLHCDVISMSFGTSTEPGGNVSMTYETLAARALNAGTLLIAAAGNESGRNHNVLKPVCRPANCPSILAVGALNRCLTVTGTSNAGLGGVGGDVDFAAPGSDIHSAWTRDEDGLLYSREDGTSMAVPFVSGIALLYAEANPGVRGRALWDLMARQVKQLPPQLPRDVGAGLVFAR